MVYLAELFLFKYRQMYNITQKQNPHPTGEGLKQIEK
jgi:hypothetical protein